MPLIIDGYNLLHASGILGRGVGPGGLERSRTALLNFLAESLSPGELAGTVVVFDARDAPPGLARVTEFRGISVRFASRGSDADQEIEQLIAAHSTPRRLTVVSSDHRLHRAARRRKAKAIDSDQWYVQILRARIERSRAKPAGRKPAEPPSEAEVQYWLKEFGLAEREPQTTSEAAGSPESPFPPGYGEDITEENA